MYFSPYADHSLRIHTTTRLLYGALVIGLAAGSPIVASNAFAASHETSVDAPLASPVASETEGQFATPEDLLDYMQEGIGSATLFMAQEGSGEPALYLYSSARRDGDRFVFEGITINSAVSPTSGSAESLTFDNPRKGPEGSLLIDSGEVRGAIVNLSGPNGPDRVSFDLLGMDDARLYPSPATSSMVTRNASDLGGARLERLDFALAGTTFTLGSLDYALDVVGNGTPGSVTVSLDDLAITNAQGLGPIIAQLPGGAIGLDVTFSGGWDPDAGNMFVEALDLDVTDIASIGMSLELSGVTEEVWAESQAQSPGAQQTPDDVFLERTRIVLTRGPSFDATLEALAPVVGLDVEAMKTAATGAIGYYAGYLGGTDELQRPEQIWEAAKAFASGEVERVELTAEPSDPPSILALEEAFDPTKGPSDRDVPGGFDLLGLSISTQ